ncbi:hypothetical protein RCO27_08380 [Sphingosinicella sp. LHD-64]|uniref:hypothetical protein n=1 Tax=Sphingosinicella sp. LHD-64 TaxID=3072139 RepID=UPI0028105F4B|nr:hypothetical protein [Sphingosinicella sp. LHD-64]MDQ8756246.1 hypothetical protein [Sphingosinicella sp. LHD-64]
MEPSKAQNGKAEADPNAGKRPGGTLLRFKKLTNHLFGRSAVSDEAPAGKDDK